jgi:hypothetical protein
MLSSESLESEVNRSSRTRCMACWLGGFSPLSSREPCSSRSEPWSELLADEREDEGLSRGEGDWRGGEEGGSSWRVTVSLWWMALVVDPLGCVVVRNCTAVEATGRAFSET